MSEPVYISRLPIFYDMQYVQENGRLTSDAYLFNEQAFKTLDAIVDQFIDGIRVPILPFSSASPGDPSIERFRDDINVPLGTIWYDSVNNKLYVKTVQAQEDPFVAGTVSEIQSVP